MVSRRNISQRSNKNMYTTKSGYNVTLKKANTKFVQYSIKKYNRQYLDLRLRTYKILAYKSISVIFLISMRSIWRTRNALSVVFITSNYLISYFKKIVKLLRRELCNLKPKEPFLKIKSRNFLKQVVKSNKIYIILIPYPKYFVYSKRILWIVYLKAKTTVFCLMFFLKLGLKWSIESIILLILVSVVVRPCLGTSDASGTLFTVVYCTSGTLYS